MNLRIKGAWSNGVRSCSDSKTGTSSFWRRWSKIDGIMESVSQYWSLEEMELVEVNNYEF